MVRLCEMSGGAARECGAYILFMLRNLAVLSDNQWPSGTLASPEEI